MDPLDAVLDRIGRTAVPGQGVCGFFRRHGRQGDDPPDRSITAHKATPILQDIRRLRTIAPAPRPAQDEMARVDLPIKRSL